MHAPPAKRSKNSDHFTWKDEQITTNDGITYGIRKHQMNLHPCAYALDVSSKMQFSLKELMKLYCKWTQKAIQNRKEKANELFSDKKSCQTVLNARLEYMQTMEDMEEKYRNGFSLARYLSELEGLLLETYYQLTLWRNVRDSMKDLSDEKPFDDHDRYNILWLEEVHSSNKYHECKVMHASLTSDIRKHLGDCPSDASGNTSTGSNHSSKKESSSLADKDMISYTQEHYTPCHECRMLFNSKSLGLHGRFRINDEEQGDYFCWECADIEMKKEEAKFGFVRTNSTNHDENLTPITFHNPNGIEYTDVTALIAKQAAALPQANTEMAATTTTTTPDVDAPADHPPLPLHQEPVATKKKRKKRKKKKKKKSASAPSSAEPSSQPEFEMLPPADKRDDSIVAEKLSSKINGNHEQLDTGTITTAVSFSSSQDFMEGSSSHEEEEESCPIKASTAQDDDDDNDSVNERLVEYLWKTNSILALAEYMDEMELGAAQTSSNA